jgi:hypothetical protein
MDKLERPLQSPQCGTHPVSEYLQYEFVNNAVMRGPGLQPHTHPFITAYFTYGLVAESER